MQYSYKYIHLIYLKLKKYFLHKLFFIVYLLAPIDSSAFENYFIEDSITCLDLQIEVLQEPFCQGSVNGGQLKVNVTSGSGNYSYEWLNDNGGPMPGGPQTDATTLSFLTINQIYWVYVLDNITSCYDSISYVFTDFSCVEDSAYLEVQDSFNLNPVGYNQYSECDIQLINLGCQLKFKPEFIITHETNPIEQGDFIIEYYNAQSNWESIPYNIDTLGNAIGYWGSQNGEVANCDYFQVRPVRVKFNQFNPTAATGEYLATLRLWSVDNNGNLISIVSEDAFVSLTLIDTICENLSFSQSVFDASCSFIDDGQIILSGINGQLPYQYSLSNSPFSFDSSFTSLSYGTYLAAIKDANGCQNSDTINLGPNPILPDSLWFNEITSSSANIYWNIDSLVDGYKFRYRMLGQPWEGPIASGLYSDGIAEMFSFKTLSNLNPATYYEVQVKVNSLTGCEEGWSTESYSFTTQIENYNYNVNNTCSGLNSGQIEFELYSENNYSFNWHGPNNFSSSDTSIYNLFEGNYNLQVILDQNIIFDTTFVISVSNNDLGVSLNGDPSLISYSEQDGVYFVQVCDLNSYVVADSGYFNYSWNYGDSINYLQNQQILIDTSNIFLQVEASDTNNCILKSDSIFISLVSDYVNLISSNLNEDYIEDVYVLCSSDSLINIDISEFISGNYSVEWRQVVGVNSILLSENPSISIYPYQNTAYNLNISSCSFDFYVNFYQSPSLDVEHTNLLCNGDSNAVIYISTDSSAIINYTLIDSLSNIIYFNSTNVPMDTIENLNAGTYTVELKDEFLCVVSQEIEILQPDLIYFDSVQINNINCFGQGYGSVLFSVNSNISPDIFILNGDTINIGQNNGYYFIDNLVNDDYNLNITDINGCSHSLNFEILESPELFFSIDSYLDTIKCYGDSTSFLSLNISGGTPNYIFQLFNSDGLYSQQILNQFDSLPANNYVAYVIDSLGCQDSLEIIISQNPMIQISEDLNQHQDVLCNGDSSGFISLIIEGGTGPYTVEILDSQLFNFPYQFSNLNEGQYSFIAFDSNGCISDTLNSEILANPLSPELYFLSNTNVECQNLGSALIELSGGVEPFTFKLNGNNISSNINSQNQIILSDLESNFYQLTIEDAFFCNDTVNFEILNNSEIIFEILHINDTLSCYSDSLGSLEVGVQNGTPPYIFDLINDGDTIATQSSYFFNDLFIGDYIISFTDAADCNQQISFSIISDEILIQDSLDMHKDVSCYGANDGEFMLNIESIYSTLFVRLVDTLNNFNQWYNHPYLFNNLSSGIYTIEIASSTNDDCPYFYSVEIIEPDTFILDSILVTNILCNGDSSGALNAYFSGGSGNFTYLYNNDPSILSQQLFAGSYNLEIIDSNGCTIDTNFAVNEPNDLVISIIDSLTFDISCFGNNDGQIAFDASGGIPPYQFSLLGQLPQNTNILTDLLADTYTVTVTDSLGCQDTITVTITEPDLNLFIDSYELSDSLGYCSLCYGDSSGFIDIFITGGTPGYSYFNVNEPGVLYSSYIDNLVGGEEYQFFVIDSLGCFSDTIVIECTSPNELVLEIESTSLPTCCYSCDAELICSGFGGMMPYSFGFENDNFQTDSLFNQLCGDSLYTFKISDSYGCEKFDSSHVVLNKPCLVVDTINYLNPNLPALINNDICKEDGTAIIYTSALEGEGNYSFSIDYGPFISQNQITFDSLFQGIHHIVVKDQLNCFDTLSFVVDEPDPIIISDLTIDTMFCGAPSINSGTNQSDIGAINVIASGGSSGEYFYSLDQIDSTLFQNSGLFENLDSGYYSMNIVDLNDCIKEFDLYIPFYSLNFDFNVSNISCPGFDDGIIQVDTVISDFNTWITLNGNMSTNNSFYQLSEGTYTLSANYFIPNSSYVCTYSNTIELIDKEPLEFMYDLSNPTCNGTCDGLISLSQLSGGTTPYNLICLNTADSNLFFDNLCADEYAIKMVDSNGCFIIKDIVMFEPNAIYPIIDFENGQLVILEPTISNPLSGLPPYSYQWYDSYGQIIGANDSLFEPSLPGEYSIVVTDDSGCIGESSLFLIEVLEMSNWAFKEVNIYPNPYNDFLNVSLDSKDKILWEISDVRGRVVKSGFDSNIWQINTSQLLNGIYFLRLKKNENELIYKIVKQ